MTEIEPHARPRKRVRIARQFAPGSFGCHEALHVAGIAGDFVETNLIEHPAVAARPEWRALAESAHKALFDLYQAIGAEHLDTQAQSGRK